MKTDKPLTATETKSLLESFRRNAGDVSVYEAKNLNDSLRKSLLQSDHAWIVVGKSKWT
jgi:hypothetical protein